MEIILQNKFNENMVFDGEIVESKATSFLLQGKGGFTITLGIYQKTDGELIASVGTHTLNEHNYTEASQYEVFSDTAGEEQYETLLKNFKKSPLDYEIVTHY